MTWTLHHVVFRLRSPLHAGRSKVGNVQRTHPYLPGRPFWGGLTMRLTRLRHLNHGPADDSALYRAVGDEIQEKLAWTCFFPALEADGTYVVQWPWAAAEGFARRFLNSYASTALVYPQQAAAEATLHEVEFISPHTIEESPRPVFLAGYVFSRYDAANDWRDACRYLQFGGERGYGWGDVRLVSITEPPAGDGLFAGAASIDVTGDRPVAHVEAGGHVPAHSLPAGGRIGGLLEPLVGREWRTNNPRNRHSGAYVEYTGFFLMPGATALEDTRFTVGHFGLWSPE